MKTWNDCPLCGKQLKVSYYLNCEMGHYRYYPNINIPTEWINFANYSIKRSSLGTVIYSLHRSASKWQLNIQLNWVIPSSKMNSEKKIERLLLLI